MRVDKDAQDLIRGVLDKLSLEEQVEVRRNSEELRETLVSLWRENCKHLDLQALQSQLLDQSLKQFMRRMRRHFRSVSLQGAQLQEQLNLLDRCGIKELPNVRQCCIAWSSSNRALSNVTQWPLHALPKLLSRLRSLELELPLQVKFVEQFTELKHLTLHASVNEHILGSIFTGCKCLTRLKLLGEQYESIAGIADCKQLRQLTLPVASFNASSAFEILELPQLQALELLLTKADAEAIMAAATLVLQQRAQQLEYLQLNAQRMQQAADWLPQLQLRRCKQLETLALLNCQFAAANLHELYLPHYCSSAMFSHCQDMQDEQLLDFVRSSAQLTQLHLINCSQLTGQLLYDLYKLRASKLCELSPLCLHLRDCPNIEAEFQLNFLTQSVVQLSAAPLEQDQSTQQQQHMQFCFFTQPSVAAKSQTKL
ncbi:CG14316 [Drosophila busckii]|uniref:CG14316 n=2 Tax=Drosophila busckii TaxID=30019 RepID=A0A0M5JCE6_DROBS|nr:CG14316 [Drosophila busckii]